MQCEVLERKGEKGPTLPARCRLRFQYFFSFFFLFCSWETGENNPHLRFSIVSWNFFSSFFSTQDDVTFSKLIFQTSSLRRNIPHRVSFKMSYHMSMPTPQSLQLQSSESRKLASLVQNLHQLDFYGFIHLHKRIYKRRAVLSALVLNFSMQSDRCSSSMACLWTFWKSSEKLGRLRALPGFPANQHKGNKHLSS